ncbi:dTDP-4-amino-4,6-dideoxygalactose transaminase [unidentified bacterial endosymbiont]|uniref:dTDP-4-amino-4,6-dideoxygalactose transaminase n=1 Tax=unidentified bacterial endosymbiont TaxID=2355 RepID=UPI00209F3DC2|nr:dTDP-4-amino-4,6-dideoxygalactose transaminase [unidentified bacterial endosymbiont]
MPSAMIPFNKLYQTGNEIDYLAKALLNGRLAGDGPFTQRCQSWLRQQTSCCQALLTHSCTAALEMTALLLNIQPGDEIIMPSYTFVSTANAFALRGGVPVFIDIRYDTLNIDENLIEAAITSRTRAIAVVHYAGVACEMQAILAIAKRHGLAVVEDAAHGMMARYHGQLLGSLGDLGAYSFHDTKNIISGEGGSLLINDSSFVLSAETIRQKGTNRSRFLRGEVDKYTWETLGSSFLPSELTAAFLWAQLEQAEWITQQRLALWEFYQEQLKPVEQQGLLRRPVLPSGCQHNAHLYYLLLSPEIDRQVVLEHCKQQGVSILGHYDTPLHRSPGGQRYGRTSGQLVTTDAVAQRLIRLPLWIGLSESEQARVVKVLETSLLQ